MSWCAGGGENRWPVEWEESWEDDVRVAGRAVGGGEIAGMALLKPGTSDPRVVGCQGILSTCIWFGGFYTALA